MVTQRTTWAILVVAMRRMPSAASIGSMPERLRDLLGQRLLRGSEIERHLAAEEAVGAEPAEDEIGVGDGRLGAAEAVADRAGRRARAFRADAQGVADLDAGDAAAAGADLLDVDHRHLHRQARGIAADQRRAGHQHGAFIDHAGLGGGAAHVERDGVGEADRVAQRLGADDASRRARIPACGCRSAARRPTSNSPPVDCTIRKLPPKPASPRCVSISVR